MVSDITKQEKAITNRTMRREERDRIKKEINMTALSRNIRIFQLAALIVWGIVSPIAAHMMHATTKQLTHYLFILVPVVGITIPVGIYKIKALTSKKEELQEKLKELESRFQEGSDYRPDT